MIYFHSLAVRSSIERQLSSRLNTDVKLDGFDSGEQSVFACQLDNADAADRMTELLFHEAASVIKNDAELKR